MTNNSHSETLDLVFSSDERFAMPLAVTVSSTLQHLPTNQAVRLHVLDGGIREASKRKVEYIVASAHSHAQLHWVIPKRQWLPDLTGFRFANTNLNETAFYRLAAPHFLPSDCHRALYLDADTVILTDVTALLEEIPDDAATVAVRDYGIPTLGHRFRGRPVGLLSNYDPDARYFNSGVLGINVDYWREHAVADGAIQIVEQFPTEMRFADQDALNIALYQRWVEVDLGWNLGTGGPDRIRREGGSEQIYLGEPYEQIRQRARIIHFTGNKPWDQGFTNPDRPAFVEALRRSGWFTPLEFRCWQAGWWAKLVKRQIGKRLGSSRPRVSQAQTESVNSTETT